MGHTYEQKLLDGSLLRVKKKVPVPSGSVIDVIYRIVFFKLCELSLTDLLSGTFLACR
jgi:hypothetical protein